MNTETGTVIVCVALIVSGVILEISHHPIVAAFTILGAFLVWASS